MLFIGIGDLDIPKVAREEKGKSIIAFPDKYCVIDTETTGLSPEWDDLIEVGAIRYQDGQEVGRFQSLIRPLQEYDDGSLVSEFITELTGITNEMLSDAPTASEIIPKFADFIGTDLLVGYNTHFDINFLYDAFEENLHIPLTNDFIDLMRFSRKLFPELPHHRLQDMVKLFSVQTNHAHRVLAVIIATNECFVKLRDEAIKQYGSEEAFSDSFRKKYHSSQGLKAIDIIGDESKHNPDSPLYKKNCVFTGKLEKLTRRQAMQIVADLGGTNEDGVTKSTNYLILGNNDYCSTIKGGKSSKQKKAESYKLKGQDIEIIPETVFYDMLDDFFN